LFDVNADLLNVRVVLLASLQGVRKAWLLTARDSCAADDEEMPCSNDEDYDKGLLAVRYVVLRFN
jgi:hypothetical protein